MYLKPFIQYFLSIYYTDVHNYIEQKLGIIHLPIIH